MWSLHGCRLSSPWPRGRCRGLDADASVVSAVTAAGMLPCPATGILSADRGDTTLAVMGMRPWLYGSAAVAATGTPPCPQRRYCRGLREEAAVASASGGGRRHSAIALAAKRRYLPGGGLEALSLHQDGGIFLSMGPRCCSGGGTEAASRRQRSGIVLPVLSQRQDGGIFLVVGPRRCSGGEAEAASWSRRGCIVPVTGWRRCPSVGKTECRRLPGSGPRGPCGRGAEAVSWRWGRNIVLGLSRRRVIPMLLGRHVVLAEGQRFVAEALPWRRFPGGGAEAVS